jgi:hypothetical protein
MFLFRFLHITFFKFIFVSSILLELYLYIVVSLIVKVFPAYYTHVHVLYIVAFGPYGIQLVYS